MTEEETAATATSGGEEVDAFDDLLENIDPSELSPQTWNALKRARRIQQQREEQIRKQTRNEALDELGILESKKEGKRLVERGALASNPAADFHKASGGSDPKSKVYSAHEFLQIFASNPAEADQIAREGRVQFKHRAIQGRGSLNRPY